MANLHKSQVSTGTQIGIRFKRCLVPVLKVEYRYSKQFKVQRILSTSTES